MVSLIFPLYLIMALGYLLKKTRFVDDSFTQQLNRVIYHILLPLLLFFITCRLDLQRLRSVALWGGFPLIIAGTAGLACLVALPLPQPQKGAFIQGAFRTNLSYLGLPIAIMVLGEKVGAMAAVLVGVGAVANTIFSVLVLNLSGQEQARLSWGRQVREILVNPLILSIAAGFVFSAGRLPLPGIIVTTITMLSRICLPSILLVMGLTLSLAHIKDYLLLDGLAVAIKLVVMPVIGVLVMRWLGAPPDIFRTVVVFCAMPTAVVSHTFAKQFGADEALTASIVNSSTLALVVVLPVLLMVIL